MQPAEKMTMTLLKLLSDEEEGFIFSERHKVNPTKKITNKPKSKSHHLAKT